VLVETRSHAPANNVQIGSSMRSQPARCTSTQTSRPRVIFRKVMPRRFLSCQRQPLHLPRIPVLRLWLEPELSPSLTGFFGSHRRGINMANVWWGRLLLPFRQTVAVVRSSPSSLMAALRRRGSLLPSGPLPIRHATAKVRVCTFHILSPHVTPLPLPPSLRS
jgi:hypothetical protein